MESHIDFCSAACWLLTQIFDIELKKVVPVLAYLPETERSQLITNITVSWRSIVVAPPDYRNK